MRGEEFFILREASIERDRAPGIVDRLFAVGVYRRVDPNVEIKLSATASELLQGRFQGVANLVVEPARGPDRMAGDTVGDLGGQRDAAFKDRGNVNRNAGAHRGHQRLEPAQIKLMVAAF